MASSRRASAPHAAKPGARAPASAPASAPAPAPAPARSSPPGPGPDPEAGDSAATAIAGPPAPGVRVLKKYPNRRLYDTEISSYITLTDVKAMVLNGLPFEVRDAKSGEDLTRSILLQIILEEETGGVPIFSAPMLAQIIRFYGHAMQGMMGSYLETNLQTFTDIQARLAEQTKGLYDAPAQTPEMWSQFLNGQAPTVQKLMGSYLEQSKSMFFKVQEQMARQAETLLKSVPAIPPPPKR